MVKARAVDTAFALEARKPLRNKLALTYRTKPNVHPLPVLAGLRHPREGPVPKMWPA
ncbi:MAG: hypothetical protein AMXMBFR84_16280 [Candidatus Hydrogenedentota bacterium]